MRNASALRNIDRGTDTNEVCCIFVPLKLGSQSGSTGGLSITNQKNNIVFARRALGQSSRQGLQRLCRTQTRVAISTSGWIDIEVGSRERDHPAKSRTNETARRNHWARKSSRTHRTSFRVVALTRAVSTKSAKPVSTSGGLGITPLYQGLEEESRSLLFFLKFSSAVRI